MEIKQPVYVHKVEMNARKNITFSGIKDVRSFDEQEAVLETSEEAVVLRGEGLHVERLSLERGEVDITGKVDSLNYADLKGFKNMKEPLLKRLFR